MCTIEGCAKPSRNPVSDAMCMAHYMRWYRHGDPHKVATRIATGHGRKYISAYMPHHPVAGKRGKVWVHRAVLYDTIGAGTHPCHWCATPVTWELPKGDPAQLHVDHLDGHGDNNHPVNLVPSCMRCNGARGSRARSHALEANGWFSVHPEARPNGAHHRVA